MTDAQTEPSGVAPDDLFDIDWYLKQFAGFKPHWESERAHYERVGWRLRLSPHPLFDTRWYLAENPDVLASGVEPLRHFLTRGLAEGRSPHPLVDVAHLARQCGGTPQEGFARYRAGGWHRGMSPHPLVSPNFLISACGFHPLLEPVRQYLDRCPAERTAPHPRFDSTAVRMRRAARGEALGDPFLDYLRGEVWGEIRRLPGITDLLGTAGHAAVLAALGDAPTPAAHPDADPTVWREVIAALCLMHLRRFDEAAVLVDGLPSRPGGDPGLIGLEATVLRNQSRWNAAALPAVHPQQARRPGAARVVVYTTLFGDSDTLAPPLCATTGLRFVCFTDVDRPVPGWEMQVVPRTTPNANLEAKRFKVLPWEYLPDADYSMFVDANTVLCGDLPGLVERLLVGEDFAAWAHPERAGMIEELFAVWLHERHAVGPIFRQVRDYLEAGTPPVTGMIEASFLWRRHDSADVRKLMSAWWQEIITYTTRDQISLARVMHTKQIRPSLIPPSYGTSRTNAWFAKTGHRHAPRATTRPTRCAFVYSPAFARLGSTVMRCFQAAQILSEGLPGTEFACRSDLDVDDTLLVLSKGYLEEVPRDVLEKARIRGNTIVGDPVDNRPPDRVIDLLDGVVAASIGGYVEMCHRYPHTRILHLTHAHDPRLPDRPALPTDRARIGYIGIPDNTRLGPRVAPAVTVVPVDDDPAAAWLDRTPDFNVHYAIRRHRPEDHRKPFLKGFTAARLGAVVIASRDDAEAVYYLGPDYPYLAESTEPDDVLPCVELVQSTFGGPAWRLAQDRMASLRERSDHAHVVREFAQMLTLV